MKAYKNIVFVLVLGVAILAQLMNPTLARADGEPPPVPTDSATEVVPPELPVATETPVAAEISPIGDSSIVAPVEPVATEEPTLLEVFQEIPEGTNIVVLDETGQAVPLAVQEAEDIIAENDPIWCPTGQSPRPGANGCTASYATLGDLLANVATVAYINAQTVNGTIWITSGAITDAIAVSIDGGTYSNWGNYALTLQGGWNGTSAGTISGTSVFSVPISIINWNNNVAVRNVTIKGATTGTGLTVNATGNINLNNVSASGNGFYGAELDNSSGTGNVTLTGKNSFNNNLYGGLVINSAGSVSLNNITANGHSFTGVSINNTFGTGNVTLTGTNVFNNNNNWGLRILSSGAITLNNVTASGNFYDGTVLENTSGTGAVTLTGKNVFNGNADFNGLVIYSAGDVRLHSVTANGNSITGVLINNTLGTGIVTLTGTNVFKNNGSVGLSVLSSGDITLNNVNAIGNGNDGPFGLNSQGANLDNTSGTGNVTINKGRFDKNYIGAKITSNGDVTINASVFSANDWDGLQVHSNNGLINSIELNKSKFSYNNRNYTDGYGAWLNTDAGDIITVLGNQFLNNASGLVAQGTANVNSNILSANTFNLNCIDLLTILVTQPGNYCGAPLPPPDDKPTFDIAAFSTRGAGAFALNCAGINGFAVNLPNGDLVNIYCPVRGEASIDRVDNTTLPADLPTGYSYASAFKLDILQDEKPIPVITEGGYITASFVAQPLQAGNTYSILYWDNGTWVPLKDFMLDENNQPQVFDLSPGVPDDTRKIIRGVNLVTKRGSSRVEISTNFPGLFVLVQQ